MMAVAKIIMNCFVHRMKIPAIPRVANPVFCSKTIPINCSRIYIFLVIWK
jgi:hypothetical protein